MPDVYDKEDTNLDDLEKSFHGPSATESGSQKLADTRPGKTDMRDFEKAAKEPSATESGSGKLAQKTDKGASDASTLANAERSSGDSIKYTGSGKPGDEKTRQFLEKLRGSSKLKKRILIAGALAGGSVIGSIFVFLALLPLKIEHIVTGAGNKFSSPSNNVLEKEIGNEFSDYVKSDVISSLRRGTCHSTIDPSCVITSSDTSGFLGKERAAWSQGKAMNKLANLGDNGIIIGKKGNTFYMNTNGRDINMASLVSGQTDLFHLAGTNVTTRNQIRRTVNTALKDGTKWDKTYNRFVLGKYLELHGIKRCVIACDFRDKFTDTIEHKKLAGKLKLAQLVVSPFSQSYGVLLQCILSPQDCDTKLSPNTDGREESALNTKLDAQLTQYIAEHGADKLADLAKQAGDINKLGLGGYISKILAEEIADKIAGTGAKVATGEAIDKAVPIVGQVQLLLSLAQTAQVLPAVDKDIAYTSRAIAAAQTYNMFNTVVSEQHSGHMDATEFGSFVDLLGDGAKDANGNSSDVTATPLYNATFKPTVTSSASIFSDLLGGNAFAATADSTSSTSSTYRCNDGQPVAAGKLVCPEENFADPGLLLKILNVGFDNGEAALLFGSHIPSYLPGAKEYNSAVAPIFNSLFTLSNWVGDIFSFAGTALVDTCGAIPPCSAGLNKVSSLFGEFAGWLIQQAVPNPLSSMTGGRMGDMLTGGADVIGNMGCQDTLGCQKISAKEAANQQNEQLGYEKADFQAMPMFARLFSTDSPYSLVSQLAMSMPTNMLSATNSGLASVFSNPLHTVSSLFSGMLSPGHAFAATAPEDDPFGITQYGYTDADIPAHPEQFWNQNCVNGPIANFDDDSGQLDVSSDWLDAHTTQDDNTEQAISTAVNPCLLIQSTVISGGAIFDTSVVPADALNSDPTDAGN